jgi:hypothetical protein
MGGASTGSVPPLPPLLPQPASVERLRRKKKMTVGDINLPTARSRDQRIIVHQSTRDEVMSANH